MAKAPPSFNVLTSPKVPLPKATPQAGKTPPPANGAGGWRAGLLQNPTTQITDPKKTGQDYGQGDNEPGTQAIHLNQIDKAGSDKVAKIRQELVQAGYDVAAEGAGTPRLKKAFSHYIATKGGGAKVWNAHNLQQTHPAVAPQNVVKGPLHASTAPAAPSALPVTPEQLPNDQVAGAPTLPPGLQALLDKEFAPYSGDTGQPTIVDPKKLAASQADLQYGGAITQGQTDIRNMVGAAPGAQANIAKYFAPVKAQAASNVASDDDANAKNVAAQAQLSPGLLAALGLSGADAGSIAANSKAGTDFASNMATLNHSDDLNAQSAADRAEQQAHTTEDSNSTIALSGARAALLQNLAAKGQAQTVDEGTNRQQNFVNRTQGIANKAAIGNINATNALAKTNVIQGMLQNAGTAQTQDINKRNSDTTQTTTRAQLKAAAAALQQTLINNKRLTLTPIPGATDPNATTKIPFTGINAGDRDTLAAGLWAKFGNLPPAKAEQQLNSYMTSFYGYNSTPAIRAWIKSTVQQHQWDAKDKKYKA